MTRYAQAMRKALLAVGLTSLILAAATLIAVWSGLVRKLLDAQMDNGIIAWQWVGSIESFAFGIGGLGVVCLVIGAKLKP